MDLEMIQRRADIIRQVRLFFDSKNYLETDTPLLSPDLIPESCLEVFETRRLMPGMPEKGTENIDKKQLRWLVPSPEIWMKKIIKKHRVNIYQICKCFRNGEAVGRLHNTEFTMLEYYTMQADYLDSLTLTQELFSFLKPESQDFERLTMIEAFGLWAGFDLFDAAEKKGGMEAEARRLGLDPMPGLDVPALYDLIFIAMVEPKLREKDLVALMDYPAFVPCLAKKNGRITERWELYGKGIELANCYSEETNPELVRLFFENESLIRKKSALVQHHVNHDYWKMFLDRNAKPFEAANSGFPPCSGVAMGLDRLIMYLCGKSTIDQVMLYREQ